MTEQYDINIEGDVVLIHHQEKPTLYARIEEKSQRLQHFNILETVAIPHTQE